MYATRSFHSFSHETVGARKPKTRRSRIGIGNRKASPTLAYTHVVPLDRKLLQRPHNGSGSIYKNPLLGSPKRMTKPGPEVENQNYIEEMFVRIGQEREKAAFQAQEEQEKASRLSKAKDSNSNVNVALENREMAKKMDSRGRADELKVQGTRVGDRMRRIEVPWRNAPTFTSRTEQQNKTFETFLLVRNLESYMYSRLG